MTADEPTIVALIPARSGSQRVPGKNVRRLGSHPLLAYSIAAARGPRIRPTGMPVSRPISILVCSRVLSTALSIRIARSVSIVRAGRPRRYDGPKPLEKCYNVSVKSIRLKGFFVKAPVRRPRGSRSRADGTRREE